MKMHKIIIPLSLIMAFLACKKELAIEPEQSISDQVVFTTKSGAQSALNGVYSTAQILDVFGGIPLVIGDYQADNVEFVGSFPTLQEINLFTTLSTNTSITPIWQNHYRVILRANSIIARVPGISETGFTDAQKKQMVGEAKFMRAFMYFQLVNLFAQPYTCNNGNNLGVPLVLEEFTGNVAFPARNTVAEVYAQIKKDLDEAAVDLAPQGADANTRGRATKGAAQALLSRLHLYKGEWQLAADNAKLVLDATSAYQLAANYNFFSGAPTPEHILVSIMTTTDNSRTGSGGLASYFRPTSQPLNPATGGGRGDAPFTTNLVQAYLQEAGDRRLGISDSAVAADGIRKRFSLKYSDGINNTDDAQLIRVSEMYLNRAEALAELNGINTESINLINALRTRAGLPNWTLTTFATKADLINGILNERRKELAFEGHRRMDLLRRGQPLRTTGATAAASKPCDPTNSPKVILPIPQREIDINPSLRGQQNPGY